MVNFVGRSAELNLLAGALQSARSEFIPIYGRRRVGKSELILKFMSGKPGIYYLGKQSPATCRCASSSLKRRAHSACHCSRTFASMAGMKP